MATKHPRQTSDWLDLSPPQVEALRARLQETRSRRMTMGEFMVEAGHLVSSSLLNLWVSEGNNTPEKILSKMGEEWRSRRVGQPVTERRNSGDLTKVLPKEEFDDDIPF